MLTGGDIPAMALIDGCVRLLPSVVGKEASLGEESFGNGEYAHLLEYPHYTKPNDWEGRPIPRSATQRPPRKRAQMAAGESERSDESQKARFA